jgi:hypothetical protein
LPLAWFGELIAGGFVRAKVRKMFDYRHQNVAKAWHKLAFVTAHAN